MPTNTLINPSDVKGNISSCKTETAIVTCASRDNLLICHDRGWATNNCTGETETLNSWSLSGFSSFILVIVGFFIFTVFLKWLID